MNINELNTLASIANHNEDVIVNKTKNLRDEVRDWCIEEMTKIEAEKKKLLDFVNWNQSLFCDKCGTPYFGLYGMCYAKTSKNGNYGTFTDLLMNMDRTNYFGFESYWQSASVRRWTTKVQGCAYPMELDIEYWTRMKKCIDFRWWELNEMCENCKRIINDRIDKQKERMDEIVGVCKEIDNATNDVEVTITIHKVN